jgi:SAM-dependent methyltransferase
MAGEGESRETDAQRSEPSRAERSRAFGAIAGEYERFRPGPVPEVVEWLLPSDAKLAVDLGAGTGALTRLLVDRVPSVVAVEPDERMRAVLSEQVPGARVMEGRGESIPLGEGVADAVLASSSWHWMDLATTVPEVARVLRFGGVLGVVCAAPDWTSEWFQLLRPRAMLERMTAAAVVGHDAAAAVADAAAETLGERPANPSRRHELVLPDGAPFSGPERTEIRWTLPMTPEELVGLIGTYSGVILIEPAQREALFDLARSYLLDEIGLADGVATKVPYRAVCWRAVHRQY